jgi:hypothetical protein
MTRSHNRIRFEIRVLGVATAETFHFDTEIPGEAELPAVGQFASPPLLGSSASHRVMKVERMPSGSKFAAVVTLEPIDISYGERHMDEETGALLKAGWRP